MSETFLEVDRTIGQPQAGALDDLRRETGSGLPTASEVRTRELLGVPIAMTDYERAMDVMDGMIARGERGYVCCVAVHAVSAVTGEGLEALDPYLEPGKTVALLGSSGVGKSTLVNRFAGREVLETAETSAGGTASSIPPPKT